MGQQQSSRKPLLQDVKRRTETRFGKISGRRHHYLPHRLEDDYELTNHCLGSGAYASVYVVRDKHTESTYALKKLRHNHLGSALKKQLQDECEICLAMDHPHVVRLVDVYESKHHLQLVMEHLRGGELFDRVVRKGGYSDKEASEAVYQMLLAVNFLHRHDIVHRDIKLENFVYQNTTDNHLKLIDFGFSKMCAQEDDKMSDVLGTVSYMAPEVFDKQYSKKSDVWSLGVIAFILVLGYMPFGTVKTSERQREEMIKSGKFRMTGYEARWAGVPAMTKDFLHRLLVVDPSFRPDVEEALIDPWIKKYSCSQMVGPQLDSSIVNAMMHFPQAPPLIRACMFMAASFVEEDPLFRKAFLSMDRDHDGKITISELKQSLEEGARVGKPAIETAFKAFDLNESKQIDYSEFSAAMFVTPHVTWDERVLQRVFERIDTDGSGVLTHKNLTEALPKELMDEADFSPTCKFSCVEFVDYVMVNTPKDLKLSQSACDESTELCCSLM